MTIDPFSELPLALFSTLMPLSVGSYLAMAISSFCSDRERFSSRKMLQGAAVPLLLIVLAFVAAFFHLASPLSAFYVLDGIGRSPLSSEIAASGLYFLAGFAYLALLASGKLGLESCRVMLSILSVLGLFAAVMIGLAYHVDTIIGWASPWPAIEQIGYSLSAAMIGALVANARCCFPEKYLTSIAVAALCGFALSIFANGAHLFQVMNSSGTVFDGSSYASAALPYALSGLVVGVVSMVLFLLWVSKGLKAGCEDVGKALPALAIVALFAAVFLARMSFYCLQLGLGLA